MSIRKRKAILARRYVIRLVKRHASIRTWAWWRSLSALDNVFVGINSGIERLAITNRTLTDAELIEIGRASCRERVSSPV